jgi:hypothetical protein
VLACVGVTLLAAVFLAALVVAIPGGGGYDWPDDALVAADGELHEIATSTSRPTLVWALSESTAASCDIADVSTGEAPALRPVDGDYRRGAEIADWTAVAAFDAPSSRVVVTCAGTEDTAAVAVQAQPRVPAALADFSTWALLPLLLGLAGLATLLGSAALVVRGTASV